MVETFSTESLNIQANIRAEGGTIRKAKDDLRRCKAAPPRTRRAFWICRIEGKVALSFADSGKSDR